MNILILALIFAILSIGISLFGLLYKPKLKIKKEEKKTKDGSLVPKLENQIKFLERQLEKIKSDYSKIQAELGSLSKKESDLKEELARQITSNRRTESDLEKAKSDYLRLREDLVNKEKVLEEKIQLNLKLNRDLNEKKEIIESLEKQNKEFIEKVRSLEAKILEYSSELENKNKIIAEFKEKEKESEWVSKREYFKLKRQLEEKEKILKNLQISG